jgi:hypothetical protein
MYRMNKWKDVEWKDLAPPKPVRATIHFDDGSTMDIPMLDPEWSYEKQGKFPELSLTKDGVAVDAVTHRLRFIWQTVEHLPR